jgi:hypothetical protein
VRTCQATRSLPTLTEAANPCIRFRMIRAIELLIVPKVLICRVTGHVDTGTHRSRIRERSRLRSNEPDYQANGHSNQTNGGHEQERKEKYVAPGVVFM